MLPVAAIVSARSTRFRFAVSALALAAVAIPLGFMIVQFLVPTPSMEQLIRKANFEPLNPPSRLRGPGALYVVETDRSYTKVCDPDREHLMRVLQESDSQNWGLERLMNGKYSLMGNLFESLKAALRGQSGVSVTYRLSDVKVIEVAMDQLNALQASMLTNEHCAAVVQKLIKSKKTVCAGSQALKATASYKLHAGRGLEATAQEKNNVANIARKTIEQQVGSNIEFINNDEAVGTNLFYGIRLNSLCITPLEATEPVHSPQTEAAERARVSVRF